MDNTARICAMLEYLNRLDDYTLGIICEITTAGRVSTADLARRHGISRQGMHRKLLDTWRKYPALRSFLAADLMMARKRKEPPPPVPHRKKRRRKWNTPTR